MSECAQPPHSSHGEGDVERNVSDRLPFSNGRITARRIVMALKRSSFRYCLSLASKGLVRLKGIIRPFEKLERSGHLHRIDEAGEMGGKI